MPDRDIQAAVATLRELNEPVPRPFRLPTEGEIAAAEDELGVKFSADYRYFLLHGSDVAFGALEPAVVIPDSGHLDLVEVVQGARKLGTPKHLLPICEDNADYYCLAPDGRVVFWSHNGTTDESWPSLADWILDVWIAESQETDDE